jgi:hypothetical protein
VTSSYRMPTIGGSPAGSPSVGKPNALGTGTMPRPSVSAAGQFLDYRSPEQVGQNELRKAQGFDDFMTTLTKIGGDVSNKFQYKVEERRAGELINNPAAMDIIKQGSGPANSLLWSFRKELGDNVVSVAATEVERKARETFSTNYLADADLKNQDWLLHAKPEDLVKKFADLQDPEATQQLRNLTVLSPVGTAPVVAGYQGFVSQAKNDIRARKIEMRLENNAVIIGRELDADISGRLDNKEALVQAQKDGFGGEVEAWTVKNVDEVAPTLKAKAKALDVPVSTLLERNVQQAISRIDMLAATAQEQIHNDQDHQQTLEDMQKEWQRVLFYRALGDSPDLKTSPEDASVFSIRNAKTGKTLDETITEYRKAYFSQVDSLQRMSGEQLAAQAQVEIALDPLQTSESVNAKVGPLLAQAKDWRTRAAIIAATKDPLTWKMQMDDRQRVAIGRQAEFEIKALRAQGLTPTEEDLKKILAYGEAGLPGVAAYVEGQQRDEQKQDIAAKQQEAQLAASVNSETSKWFPDPSRIAGAAVDLKGMIQAGKKNKTIAQSAVVLDDAGLQQTIKQRTMAILSVKMQEELQRTGANEVPQARAEVIAKEALDKAVEYALSSLPPPPKVPPGAALPPRGGTFAIEEAAFDAEIRANGGRPTKLAIPSRIREQVLKQNPRASFTDLMAVWNKESAGNGAPGLDGKPFYTKDIGTQRQQRLRSLQEEAQKNGTAKPSVQVRAPYLGDPFKASRDNLNPAGLLQKAVNGWSMFGLTPKEVTPPDETLNAAMPKVETVSVTVPAAAAKPSAVDNSGIPPAALPKIEAGVLRLAGVDPTKTAGVAKPLLNNDPNNMAFAGAVAAGKAKIEAHSPPLPQAAPELEAVRISPNARSKDSPWIYAVLATSYKATARGMGGNITLPDWQFDRRPGSLGLEGRASSGGDFIPNSSGQYIATGVARGLHGMSADGQTQTLHGIVGREGYDAKHGVGNEHVHHQGPDAATTLELAKYLRSKGFPITEFMGFKQAVGGHSDSGGHYDGSAFDVPVPISQHAAVLKAMNDFYVNKGRRGEGIQRAGGGHLVMNEKNRYVQAIGFAEGNLDRNGRPTGSYAGHTDPGNAVRNVGIFSAQGSGSSPEAANREWFGKLNKVAPVFDNALQKRGVKPDSPVYKNIMANLLDLYVQAPEAVQAEGGLLSRVNDMIRFKGDPAYIAQARADSFVDTRTGKLNAPGFGNNRNRLLQDQRRRAAALKERL